MKSWGVLACIAGLAAIGFNANESILATGGYSEQHAPLILVMAIAMAVGSCCIGIAYGSKRWAIFGTLLAGLCALEGFTFLSTAERVIVQRENSAEPARILAVQRLATEKLLAELKAAVPTTTTRLDAAMAAKRHADEAMVTKAAEKSCVTNCRQLLTKASDDAARELTSARQEYESMKATAQRKVSEAEAKLASLPAPKSETPFADRLNLPGWILDLVYAGLKSLGVNGLGAALLAFGAHGSRHSPRIELYTPQKDTLTKNSSGGPAQTITQTERSVERDAKVEANKFARASFRPASDASVRLVDIRTAYHAWCQEQGIRPLPDREIGAALSSLFSKVGLVCSAGAVAGIAWAESHTQAITKAA